VDPKVLASSTLYSSFLNPNPVSQPPTPDDVTQSPLYRTVSTPNMGQQSTGSALYSTFNPSNQP
jgi:hypothetical protein